MTMPENRRPALLVLDVEGTLFEARVRLPGTILQSTIWHAIADALGPEAIAEEVATHGVWHRGGYSSYLDWMKATIEIHRRHGLEHSTFHGLIDGAEYNPGVVQFFETLDRSKWEPVLVSGGFRELTRRAQEDFGIIHAFAACEYLFDGDGVLSAYNLLPCDFEGKMDFIRLLLREYRLTSGEWIYVGDGANDVPIAQLAPMSIGFRPASQLAEVVNHVVTDFTELSPHLETWSRSRSEEEMTATTSSRPPRDPMAH